jgi:FixJ family two-component response regulator
MARVSKSKIVSIVDDDASVRAAMESGVRSLGFVTLVFESAENFLRSPRVDDSSCLITDMQMPGMSGLDLQDCLIGRGSCVPIIFITAFSKDTIRRRAQAGGRIGLSRKAVRREDYDRVGPPGSGDAIMLKSARVYTNWSSTS